MKNFFLLYAFAQASLCFSYDFAFTFNKSEWPLSKPFLEKTIQLFKIDTFFETGTCTGHTSINAAPYCSRIITVELGVDLYRTAKKKLASFSNIEIINGSSADVIKNKLPLLEGNILFYLDAHYSGGGSAMSFDDPQNPDAITPIKQELKAIRECGSKNCIILIDDARLFGTKINERIYISDWAFPTIQEIKALLMQINENYSIILIGDQLLAYDQNTYPNISISPTARACTQYRLFDGTNISDIKMESLKNIIQKATQEERDCITRLYEATKQTEFPVYRTWYDLIME